MPTYTYPAVSSVYLATPITIGDVAGANGVAFRYFSEPPVLPEFTRKRRVKIHDDMAQYTLGTPGPRLIEAVNTNANHFDVSWVADLVHPDNVEKIRGYVSGEDPENPGLVVFTIGDGVYYNGIMAEDYPEISNYRFNQRTFHRVGIKIHVLEVSSITSITTT